MALTEPQVLVLKRMLKMAFQERPDWAADQLLTLLNATQEETAYDFLRTNILSALDAEITTLNTTETQLTNIKAEFPSRT